MKKILLLIFTIIVLTINIYTVNAETIEKSNISVELLENTDYCDKKCYTRYEVCYDHINLNQDLTTKFKSDKNKTLEPENYLERYEIEMGETQNCRKLTVHGKKGIFENIDNVICINDICFNEFVWWNTSWLFRTEINFTNYVPDGFFFPVVISGIDTIFWVQKVPEQMFLYSQVTSTDLTIGNETDELYWENDSLALTGNYNKLIYDAELCYHLQNGSLIDSCNFTNGTLIDNPTFLEGIYNNGSSFDANDGINSNYGLGTFNPANNFSISMWFKKIGTLSQYGTFYASLSDDAEIRCFLFTTQKQIIFLRQTNNDVQTLRFNNYENLTGEINLVDGNWHNLIYMANGTNISNMHLYIDTIRLEMYVFNDDGLMTNDFLDYPIGLGVTIYSGGLTDYLQGGLVDEFIIWNRSLSLEEMNTIYQGGINNLTFSGTQYQYEPPFISPNMTIQITSAFNDLYYKTNSTCLNDNTLYVEWKKTILIDTLEESYSLNHTDSQIVYCPYGCTSEFDEFGGGCVKPDWQMYIFIIIAIIVIIILMLYFKNRD